MDALFDAPRPVPEGTITPAAAPDLSDYDVIAISDSGGKDSHVTLAVTVEAARAAGVLDRVWSFHASLGPLEWPSVDFDDCRYPSTGELAALHSTAYGIPAEQHIEVQRTAKDAAGELAPYSLLTFVAERGMWPVPGDRAVLHRGLENEKDLRGVDAAGTQAAADPGPPGAHPERDRPAC